MTDLLTNIANYFVWRIFCKSIGKRMAILLDRHLLEKMERSTLDRMLSEKKHPSMLLIQMGI